MINDDEYFLNDDDLAADNQPSIVDSAKVKILDLIVNSAKEIKDNIKFNEISDANSNISLLTGYVSQLIKLSELEQYQSEEELLELIEEIQKETTELTFNNIDSIIKDENEEDIGTTEVTPEDDDNSGIDF